MLFRSETGHVFQIMPDKQWRRVVASPRPHRFVEEDALREVIDAGHVVIAAGGGGVPVVEVGDTLRGVEAVVDKDRSAALLARLIRADALLILTAVARVEVHFGTPQAQPVERLTLREARSLLELGEFPEGSMGPKIEACCDFIVGGGQRAVIASLHQASEALFGGAGTTIMP